MRKHNKTLAGIAGVPTIKKGEESDFLPIAAIGSAVGGIMKGLNINSGNRKRAQNDAHMAAYQARMDAKNKAAESAAQIELMKAQAAGLKSQAKGGGSSKTMLIIGAVAVVVVILVIVMMKKRK